MCCSVLQFVAVNTHTPLHPKLINGHWSVLECVGVCCSKYTHTPPSQPDQRALECDLQCSPMRHCCVKCHTSLTEGLLPPAHPTYTTYPQTTYPHTTYPHTRHCCVRCHTSLTEGLLPPAHPIYTTYPHNIPTPHTTYKTLLRKVSHVSNGRPSSTCTSHIHHEPTPHAHTTHHVPIYKTLLCKVSHVSKGRPSSTCTFRTHPQHPHVPCTHVIYPHTTYPYTYKQHPHISDSNVMHQHSTHSCHISTQHVPT